MIIFSDFKGERSAPLENSSNIAAILKDLAKPQAGSTPRARQASQHFRASVKEFMPLLHNPSQSRGGKFKQVPMIETSFSDQARADENVHRVPININSESAFVKSNLFRMNELRDNG